jgi:Flp pilus assembly protein TadD
LSRLEALRTLLETEPEDAFVHYGLANEYYKLQDWAPCVEHIQRYLAKADDEGAAYRLLGHSLLRLGSQPEARQAFEAGIAAAERHGHPGMAEEFREILADEFD